MMDILTGIIIALATSIFTLSGKEVIDRWKKRLSRYEKKVLKMAAENQGKINIYSSDQTGEFVMMGPSALNQGAVEKAAGLEALKNLKEKDFVRHEGGVLFALTHSGFKRAAKLGPNINLSN